LNGIIPQPAEVVKLDLSVGSVHTVMVHGKAHVVLKPAIEDLGLAYSPQLRKLKARSWGVVTETVTTGADGKKYSMAVTTVRSFLMLLATVNENRVTEAKRPTLVAFQNETADAIEAYWTGGGAINPRAKLTQLDELRQEIESTRAARLREMSDYRAITAAISGAGGEREDFRDIQDYIYLELFGMSADTIRKRQPSGVAKDHLSEIQLKRLDALVLSVSSMLGAWYPEGVAPLQAIHEAVQFAARAVTHQPRALGGAA
jgi:hypothetical protein